MNKKSLSANQKIHNHLLKFLSYKKIFKIYLNFVKQVETNGKSDKIGVAVSGGPDSLGLAALCSTISQNEKYKFFFAIVDHGIRKNSDKEALQVKKLLLNKGIKLKILKNRKKIKNNIQKKLSLIHI